MISKVALTWKIKAGISAEPAVIEKCDLIYCYDLHLSSCNINFVAIREADISAEPAVIETCDLIYSYDLHFSSCNINFVAIRDKSPLRGSRTRGQTLPNSDEDGTKRSTRSAKTKGDIKGERPISVKRGLHHFHCKLGIIIKQGLNYFHYELGIIIKQGLGYFHYELEIIIE
jgi:hypothetical protein